MAMIVSMVCYDSIDNCMRTETPISATIGFFLSSLAVGATCLPPEQKQSLRRGAVCALQPPEKLKATEFDKVCLYARTVSASLADLSVRPVVFCEELADLHGSALLHKNAGSFFFSFFLEGKA